MQWLSLIESIIISFIRIICFSEGGKCGLSNQVDYVAHIANV